MKEPYKIKRSEVSMKTGYFANERAYEGMRKISIALYPPRGWHGEQLGIKVEEA